MALKRKERGGPNQLHEFLALAACCRPKDGGGERPPQHGRLKMCSRHEILTSGKRMQFTAHTHAHDFQSVLQLD